MNGTTMTFGAATTRLLQSACIPLGCAPKVLAEAIIVAALRDGMLDAILDGCHPNDLAGGHRKLANGLTYTQAAALYLIVQHSDAAGVCALSYKRFGELASVSHEGMGAALRALEVRHLVKRLGTRRKTAWKATPIGQAEAERLGATAFRSMREAA